MAIVAESAPKTGRQRKYAMPDSSSPVTLHSALRDAEQIPLPFAEYFA
jgi:hypothetical protein